LRRTRPSFDLGFSQLRGCINPDKAGEHSATILGEEGMDINDIIISSLRPHGLEPVLKPMASASATSMPTRMGRMN